MLTQARRPVQDPPLVKGTLFLFDFHNFGQGIAGPEQHASNPKEGSVGVMRCHDLWPKISADARRHAEEHQANRDQQPSVSSLELLKIAAVAEHDSRGHCERDHRKTADQRQVQQADPKCGKQADENKPANQSTESDAQRSSQCVGELWRATKWKLDEEVSQSGCKPNRVGGPQPSC